jgi:hypothetical protein
MKSKCIFLRKPFDNVIKCIGYSASIRIRTVLHGNRRCTKRMMMMGFAIVTCIIVLSESMAAAFTPTAPFRRVASRFHNNVQGREGGPFTLRDKYGDSDAERDRVNYRTIFTHDDWVEYRKPGRHVAAFVGEPIFWMLAASVAGLLLLLLVSLATNHH